MVVAAATTAAVMVSGLVTGASAGATPRQDGEIIFYEGNGATQNIVHATSDEPGQDFAPHQNDEARSAKLIFVRPGARITVFDSPSKDKRDDYAIIYVKKFTGTIIIDHFEKDVDDEYVTVVYVRNNGLNGKVSRVTVT
ncbi:hypothetical protein [Actinosynnema sp. ALI-1.44]|uniref:hypothetical protein n=1 Tax=Actinosynnema sp. ALI-1.44 TaxID=1933779 RepID=UPI001178C997|nr:hypothetical protein [Actinosynnema sp. ALI-1.44]